MSHALRPHTPTAKLAPQPLQTPQTGTWRHPKLDEIIQRRDASNFSERNVKSILWNLGGVAAAWSSARLLWNYMPGLFHTGKLLQPGANYLYYIIQTVLIFNIFLACMPLFRAQDDVSDIPLTPAQRKLLGLPPSSAPPTPGSEYITPPRYARTLTPMSSSPSNRERYSGSPLSKKESRESMSGSPFSPGASPLLQKAIGGGLGGNRRHSYGSPSPLGPGIRGVLSDAPGTPSPTTAKAGSIGLNNKWLYDKGRRNSGNVRLFS